MIWLLPETRGPCFVSPFKSVSNVSRLAPFVVLETPFGVPRFKAHPGPNGL